MFSLLFVSLFICSSLIPVLNHASSQELPFSETFTVFFNEKYEKTFTFSPSSNPNEKREGIYIITKLYNGSIFLNLIENNTNKIIGAIFLNESLQEEFHTYKIDFGIYALNCINNQSVNATLFLAVELHSIIIDTIFLIYILLGTAIVGTPIIIIHLYIKRKDKS